MKNHRDLEWLVPMAVVAACQFTLWWILWVAGFAKQPMLYLYSAISVIGLGAGCVPFLLWHLCRMYRAGEHQPIKRIKNDMQGSRVWPVIVATMLAPVTASAFTSAKSALSFAVPFYFDVPLANFERWIFGDDAWHISQSLLGWATPAIDRVYISWLAVMLVGFNVVLLSKPSDVKTRSLITYLVLWPVVGTLGSYLFSSAGPIFYHAVYKGTAFADLVPTLQREGATGALHAYDHLWTSYVSRDPTIGAGISAMPSMHVALACWVALTVRAGLPRFQWLGWTYFALIWVGSIHLGWHYALDGLAGTTGAVLVWLAAPHLAFRKRARAGIPASSYAE